VCSQACLPHLKSSAQRGRNPHILNLAPPPSLEARWYKDHLAYSIAKYGMSLCVLGMAEEFRGDGVAVNALWPRTLIATAALKLIPGIDPARARQPEILADCAAIIFKRDSRSCTGNFFIDEALLAGEGVHDLSKYAVTPGNERFALDLFVD